ncbi:hypothetical protein C8J57DRAFT_1343025 [Mycena rebaudengoi]|nr:hypothetical protein C8J57DRAFT_1343025 [Mycena rebaudengoi]
MPTSLPRLCLLRILHFRPLLRPTQRAEGPGLNDGPFGPPPGREIPGCGVLQGMPENVWGLPHSRLQELLAAKGGTEKFGRELPDKKCIPGSSRACASRTTWPPKAEPKILAGSSQMSREVPQMSRHTLVSGVLSSPFGLFSPFALPGPCSRLVYPN